MLPPAAPVSDLSHTRVGSLLAAVKLKGKSYESVGMAQICKYNEDAEARSPVRNCPAVSLCRGLSTFCLLQEYEAAVASKTNYRVGDFGPSTVTLVRYEQVLVDQTEVRARSQCVCHFCPLTLRFAVADWTGVLRREG